jgi:YbbR domain-containing protein
MKFIRKYLLHNLHLKLGALALAVLLWAAVVNEASVEVIFQAPLEFRGASQPLELSTEAPTNVQVRVRGPASVVRQLTPADLAVTANLAHFREPGERSVTLSPSNMHLPFGVHVEQIVPAQVVVRMEARVIRDLPVTPRLVGRFASGYALASYEVAPPTVRVVGPASRVNVLDSATTDPIDVTGVIARTQARVNAFVPDPMVRIAGDPSVRVVVEMKRHNK